MVIEGLNDIFENPTTPFIKVKVWDLLYHGIPINCDHDGFQAIAVCNQLSDSLGESAVLNSTHLAFSLFKAVSSRNK